MALGSEHVQVPLAQDIGEVKVRGNVDQCGDIKAGGNQSKRSPARDVRSIPPTKATSPSTITCSRLHRIATLPRRPAATAIARVSALGCRGAPSGRVGCVGGGTGGRGGSEALMVDDHARPTGA
jgi:hypothetical protein